MVSDDIVIVNVMLGATSRHLTEHTQDITQSKFVYESIEFGVYTLSNNFWKFGWYPQRTGMGGGRGIVVFRVKFDWTHLNYLCVSDVRNALVHYCGFKGASLGEWNEALCNT